MYIKTNIFCINGVSLIVSFSYGCVRIRTITFLRGLINRGGTWHAAKACNFRGLKAGTVYAVSLESNLK